MTRYNKGYWKGVVVNKLKMWEEHASWEEAESRWDKEAALAKKEAPNKGLKRMPKMAGITEDAAKNLKWKAFKWMVKHDKSGRVRKGFLKHPFKYGWGFLRSLFTGKGYHREEDLFFYGVDSLEAFQKRVEDKNTLLVVGFSYCHKPFECPSGRFTDRCLHSRENPVCQQCFIGKVMHALPEEGVLPVIIPTIHHIGEKIFEAVHNNPKKNVLFLITACELTLEMFSDWGNMVGIQGIGVRLGGRICNTMEAFALSEKGTKPGLTVVTDPAKETILDLVRRRRV